MIYIVEIINVFILSKWFSLVIVVESLKHITGTLGTR